MKKVISFCLSTILFFGVISADTCPIKKPSIFDEVRSGDKQAIRKRLENDEDISTKEEETGDNALHIAAELDDPEMIEILTTQPDRSGVINWFYYCWYDYPKLPDKNDENKEGETPIHSAIKHGKNKATQQLISKGINPNKKNRKGQTPLHYGTKYNFPEIIAQLCAQNGNPNEKDNKERTPLYYALKRFDIDLITCLAQNGADINAKDKNGKVPLHYSIAHGQLPLIKCLLENGADINKQNDTGDTPIHAAINKDSIDITEYLLQKGADTSIRNAHKLAPAFWIIEKEKTQFIPLFAQYKLLHTKTGNGDTPLHYAAISQKIASVQKLIEYPDLVNAENNQSYTALMLAAAQEEPTIVKIFHQKGINLNSRSSNGWCPIHVAAQAGKYKTLRYFLDNGVSVDSVATGNYTPLLLASKCGHMEIIKMCLQYKADVNKRNDNGENAFLLASKYKQPTVIEYLKHNSSIDLNVRDQHGRTALMNAVLASDHITIHNLMSWKVDITALDNHNENVMHQIARNGDTQAFTIMMQTATSTKLLEQQNNNGATPLLVAIANNKQTIAESLLRTGVNVHTKNYKDETPLFWAVENGNAELVQLLTQQYNAAVNIITKDGYIPLFRAVEKSYPKTTKALLNAGASLLITNNKNETILHVAAKQPDKDILRDILAQTPQSLLEITDNSGYTPLCLAAQNNKIENIHLLEQYGANPYHIIPQTGDTIVHCAINGKAIDALEYISNRHPHLLSTPNKNRETPLMATAKVNSLECAEKILKEEDFITKNIDNAITIARKAHHNTFARALEQKIKNRKDMREKIRIKGQNILTEAHDIADLDQKITHKDWWHTSDYRLTQSLSIRTYSAEELYNKTDAECIKISDDYTQKLDAARNRKHVLLTKFNDILRREEEERIKKENERIQAENRKQLEEQVRAQHIFEENQRKEEENRKRLAHEAQLERERQEEANERERTRKEQAEEHKRIDAEMVRKQKELAAAVAAQSKAQAHTEKQTPNQQQESFFPMDVKPSAPAKKDDDTVTQEKAERDPINAEKNAKRRKQAQAVRDFKKRAAGITQENTKQQECHACHEKMNPKTVTCSQCKEDVSDVCNDCWEKQKGQCTKCWNSIGQFTQKELGECKICYEDKEVTPTPCATCKVGSPRYCVSCIKAWGKCPTCHKPFDKKLMDEIIKQPKS